ncbi:hypothetical protein [Nitrosopumilus sp. b2]|uniref:hypothetical protein n=1 Tax=Nitrosopumilus sp. b2 TaxID=2109908 RepID=UPI0015F57162|nr:hypothetical protein [Nitrosopumilus sp. b2]
MKQVTLNIQRPDQSLSLVGSDVKNALPTSTYCNWTELAGLSWIFVDDDLKNYA